MGRGRGEGGGKGGKEGGKGKRDGEELTVTPIFSASVYTFACFSSCVPFSSMLGVEASGASEPLGSLFGKYSPV